MRYKFIPKIELRMSDSRKVFLCENGLKIGISTLVTNGLGYDKIRESRKTNITYEELQTHLNEMDLRVNAHRESISHNAVRDLIYITDYYKLDVHNLNNYVGKRCEEIKEGIDELIDFYKTQLEEKNAEIERLNKKLNKKGLLNRILN